MLNGIHFYGDLRIFPLQDWVLVQIFPHGFKMATTSSLDGMLSYVINRQIQGVCNKKENILSIYFANLGYMVLCGRFFWGDMYKIYSPQTGSL